MEQGQDWSSPFLYSIMYAIAPLHSASILYGTAIVFLLNFAVDSFPASILYCLGLLFKH